MDIGLSLLDRTRTRVGETDAQAIAHTVERAQRAEALGYDRFWVAEHHGVPGVAGSAPAVLLAVLAGRTTTIRLGSAGVMLPHHQPLVVAEQFATLAAVAPGRIDLGVGRSPGFTAPVRRALRQADTDFAADLADLRDHLEGAAEITARPRPAAAVPLVVLATGHGLDVAARLGLPVVVGGPLLRAPEEPLDRYRQAFRPSAQASEPWVGVSLDVLVADTDAAAHELALPEAWAMARARTTGTFPPLQPVASIGPMTATERRYVEQSTAVTGTADHVAEQLHELLVRTGAAELVASSSTHDRGALAESDAALAELVSGAAMPVRG